MFCSDTLKAVKRLQRVLEPTSPLHRRRNLDELRSAVLQVEALLQGLPSGCPQNLREDLAMGLRGIVAMNKPPKRNVSKPELYIEDDL